MRKCIWMLLMLACIIICSPAAYAAQAENISAETLVAEQYGGTSIHRLFDGRFMESIKFRSGGTITLEHEQGIGSLYILFGLEYGAYTVTNEETGANCTFGQAGFLHEFLDLEAAFGEAPQRVTLSFENGEAQISEIYAFTSGAVPDFVQRWQLPLEGESDLVLFSTHGDDEQLFFAGMLPYYSAELGYNVQVVYMTGHRNVTVRRSHEMLDGLWAVGIRNYPVFGPFGDYNSQSLDAAYQTYRNKGITREEILSFVVENVRRFRPKVAVGHDLLGEYGHGMHMIYSELLCEASEISMDPDRFPESAQQYGTWDIPKTYLHLYGENQLWMNWDIPLESFDGMTAYEVTRDLGFPCHVSQQSYYSGYFAGKETAADITENSPCEFGLFRSTVGADQEKTDFFEHVTTYAEDARLEAERQAEEAAEQEAGQATEEPDEQTEPVHSVPEEPPVTTQPESEARRNSWIPAISAGIAGILLILLLLKVSKIRK